MPSKPRRAFDYNALDIARLLEIHKTLGGSAPGQRVQPEVLNKSAMVKWDPAVAGHHGVVHPQLRRNWSWWWHTKL